MSVFEIQTPVFKVYCDHDACLASFQADSPFAEMSAIGVRGEAREAGWDVPPPRGKGSRRDTDFCPAHAEAGEGRG